MKANDQWLVGMLSVVLPMKLPSAGNSREHWAVKARRVKSQRNAVALAFKASPGIRHQVEELRHDAQQAGLELVCRLTRVAPGKRLDEPDNLSAAFKAVRDEVAKVAGLDDGSPRWVWLYAQAKCKRGDECVRIDLEVQ